MTDVDELSERIVDRMVTTNREGVLFRTRRSALEYFVKTTLNCAEELGYEITSA